MLAGTWDNGLLNWGIGFVPESPSSLGKKKFFGLYTFHSLVRKLGAWTTSISIPKNLLEMTILILN